MRSSLAAKFAARVPQERCNGETAAPMCRTARLGKRSLQVDAESLLVETILTFGRWQKCGVATRFVLYVRYMKSRQCVPPDRTAQFMKWK